MFGIFKRKRTQEGELALRYGNAEILAASVGVYDGGDCARVKLDLKICGEQIVLKDVIWTVPNSRIGEIRRGEIVSVRFNEQRAELI